MNQKQNETRAKDRRSIIVVPSRHYNSKQANLLGVEETEIVAQIHVPSDDGWAWVVLVAAFINIFILDGCVFTFGALLPDISKSLDVQDSLVALINSIQVGFYFTSGPLTAALINRFGFRTIGMMGAIICSVSVLASYFSTNYVTLLLCYGCCTGFGCSLLCMSSTLIVGFYFTKIRALALAFVSCGSSAGIMVFYPVNSLLVKLAGWKTMMLLFSGYYGITYFFSLAFRPLLSVTIAKIEEQGNTARTVTYLPSTTRVRQSIGGKQKSTGANIPEAIHPTATQRIFGTVSNTYFPTAAAVVHEEGAAVPPQQMQAQTSAAPAAVSGAHASRLKITAHTGVSQRQLKQVQSMVSRGNIQVARRPTLVEIDITVVEHIKTTCCGRLCNWVSDTPESRPMYKDDVFYDGEIEKLPAYLKSKAEIPEKDTTGLEYQMAVTRAVTVADINERGGIFTAAVRRVLATMMDPKLFKRKSFQLLCLSAFLTYAGTLVPYIFIQDRNLKAGVDPTHCAYFVSVLAFSNLIGKLSLSLLSLKLDVIPIYYSAIILSGMSTIFSGVSHTVMYQYLYSALFGFGIAAVTFLRSIVIVALYGLESLTNATGIIVMFVGLGNSFSTPLAAAIKNTLGYDFAFYMSGTFLTLGGLVATPIRKILRKEEAAAVASTTNLDTPVKSVKI